MEEKAPEGLGHPRQAAFCLRGLGWCVVLAPIAPVISTILFEEFFPRTRSGPTPEQELLISYLLVVAQWLLAWKLMRATRSPGWQRELRLARRWLALFLAGFPLSFRLFAWLSASQHVARSWTNAATFCAFGVAGLGLYMFYLHATKAVRHLGGMLRSPGLMGIADQTLTIQKLVPPLWLCAFLGMLWAVLSMEHAGAAAFLPIVWMLWAVLVVTLGAALVGLPLYWVVSYVWLLRQAAKEMARAPTTPPVRPQQGAPPPGRGRTGPGSG